jgi:hypothetical protein
MDADKGKRSLRAKKFASGKPAEEKNFGFSLAHSFCSFRVLMRKK